MGQLVAAYASTHAFTFRDPTEWDEFRAVIDAGYARRFNTPAPIHPDVARETLEANQARYAAIRQGLDQLHQRLMEDRLDVLVLIGDDQNENFKPDHLIPQLAVYQGPDFANGGHATGDRIYRSHQDLAQAIVASGVADGFDLATCNGFAGNVLSSHAHYQILENVVRELDIPVVVVFVNALHVPSIEPKRCYQFGQLIRKVIGERPANERVALFASGGLSHFTGGFPWKQYTGPFTYGSISEEFDRQCLDWLRAGEGHRWSELTSADLLHHGDVEMRSWVTLLGAAGQVTPDFVVYEPFYRGMMGMAVAAWTLDGPAGDGVAAARA